MFRQLSGSLWRCAGECVALSGIPLENRGVLVRSALSCFFIFGSSTGASKAAAQGICQRISWKITALSSSYYWPFGIRDDIIEWKMTPEASSFSPVEAWQRSTSAFFRFINALSIVGILDDVAFFPQSMPPLIKVYH